MEPSTPARPLLHVEQPNRPVETPAAPPQHQAPGSSLKLMTARRRLMMEELGHGAPPESGILFTPPRRPPRASAGPARITRPYAPTISSSKGQASSPIKRKTIDTPSNSNADHQPERRSRSPRRADEPTQGRDQLRHFLRLCQELNEQPDFMKDPRIQGNIAMKSALWSAQVAALSAVATCQSHGVLPEKPEQEDVASSQEPES
jgi:hypothetical protein